MKKFFAFFLGILFMAVLSYVFNGGLFKHQSNSPDVKSKLAVTASFYPLYFFASEIGGNKAIVKNITPAGAEPHDYEPSPQDIARIENSDLLILNGGKLEAWGDKIKSNLNGTKVIVVIAGKSVVNAQVQEEGKTVQDPHVWLSPSLAKQEVKTILQGYLEVDPKNSNYYSANTNQLLSRLDELDKEYKLGLERCQQKDIITSHTAFGYLAKAYGLNQITAAGISPDEEPSTQKLVEITQFAKTHNIKYIFFERLVSSKLSETIANEIGVKTLVLDPIEGVSDKDMKAGKNYFTIMKDNLTNLRIALKCQ